MKKFIVTMVLTLMTAAFSVMPIAASTNTEITTTDKTVKKIRKELVTLPFYGVFDNLAFNYEDGIVTLYGQVSRPTLKKDAARVVERVAGVEQVINKIDVLPLSGFDDQIRIATFRAIYRRPGFDRLGLQAVPPIHIIVNRGHVTLEGVVPTKSDSDRAFIYANSVANVFSVTNNLRVEKMK
ncbi:MAG: BON domain-containing protein [Acidobacteria bacterium]|nr:BON domain-containing protein [Acidobacteriota bacterium]